MTKDEHIAKLREALEAIRYDAESSNKWYSDNDCRKRCAIIAREALALILPSAALPHSGEISDEMVERAARQIAPVIWTVIDKFSSRCDPEYKGTVGEDWNTPLYDWPGTQKNKNKSLETARAALQAALGAKS